MSISAATKQRQPEISPVCRCSIPILMHLKPCWDQLAFTKPFLASRVRGTHRSEALHDLSGGGCFGFAPHFMVPPMMSRLLRTGSSLAKNSGVDSEYMLLLLVTVPPVETCLISREHEMPHVPATRLAPDSYMASYFLNQVSIG